ncbi:MAG: biotin--[acetyl-CoA-carboxylase] ligase [Acidobacteria bacterium]|nr:biotin--[acetyl-CoA-carboxylase] ligase [Acidobacteriota bacterium]
MASTNDLAAALAERGVEEGCIVMADAQSAGRGRYGRTWVSPPGAGLYVSIVLTPPPHTVPLLTIAAGVAVAEGIRAATGLDSHLKWPNDVYLGERKVAGVLAEAAPATATASVQYVILGIGINVAPAAYPPEIASRATSLEVELGRAVDRGLLLAECLCALAARYADLQGGREGMVIGGWRRRAAPSLGRAVRWEAADGVRVGVAEDIDARGALIVRTDTGRERIIAGEVQWV